MTWGDLLADVRARLASSVDAQRIVERACGDDWRLRLEDDVPPRAVPFVEGMVERRLAGEPLQYVVGVWGFRTLDLLVDRRVLIPRPETEVVVDVALSLLAGRDRPVAVDVGTGSGAIALSIAAECATAEVWATDVSAEALTVARANLAGMGTSVARRVRLVEGSWLDPLPGDLRADVIVSNPPYVAEDETLPPEVDDWEPQGALRAGPTGREAIEHLLAEAASRLVSGGALVVEIAPHQADALAGRNREVRVDLTGRPRVLVARFS